MSPLVKLNFYEEKRRPFFKYDRSYTFVTSATLHRIFLWNFLAPSKNLSHKLFYKNYLNDFTLHETKSNKYYNGKDVKKNIGIGMEA